LPSITTSVENGVVVIENAVCEMVLTQELPDVLDGIELGRVGRQRQQRDVGWQLDDGFLMIAGAIHDQDGMSARHNGTADLIEVRRHRLGIGAGQDKSCGTGPVGTDRSEEIGPFVALVARRGRACAAPCPPSGQASLLANAGFILEPDLDRLCLGGVRQRAIDEVGEVFLNASWARSSALG